MTTQLSDVAKLQMRVTALEQKVEVLEAELAQRGMLPQPAATIKRHPTNEPLWAELLARGIIRLPIPAELAIAAEWQALPEVEKEATRKKLRELKLTPSLSEIIRKMRAGWYPDESEWAVQP